jgi:poly(glycerol-phosphate) alpha-glucosyltransferase
MCFAISKPVAEDLSINFHINKNKVHIVRNYFSRKIFKYKKRRENYLLYIGRISDEKNLDVMLEAYSKLKEIAYKKQPKLVIVGNGNISSLVKKSCSLNIYKDIIIQGYKRNVYNFYQNAIALLLPSRIEGGPRVGFESMIIGCPIISSDFIGRDKTIFSKNKVFLFQNNSVPSLLKTILLVLDKPDLRKRRATLARNKMKSIYSSNFYNNHSKHIFNLIY